MEENRSILGVTVLRPRCYYGGQVKERGVREGGNLGYHTFLIAISNTFAQRLMRNVEKFRHRGDVPPRCDSAATGT